MSQPNHSPKVVTTENLAAYFHTALQEAARNQHLSAGDATLHYLTHMMSTYARSDQVFDHGEDGLRLTPLANMYSAALDADSAHERRLWLQRLGDVALFVSGVFAGRLSRRFADIDYCIAMGGNAYGYLEQTAGDDTRGRSLAEIFGELSAHFARFAELLAEVGDRKEVADGSDLLRLYEAWRETGNPVLERRLRAFGLIPATTSH